MLLSSSVDFFPRLQATINEFRTSYMAIPASRRSELEQLAKELTTRSLKKLNFICTHNSRRSHLAQVWAGTLAIFFELAQLETYSGGTEATAFNPRAVAALRRQGFLINQLPGHNPFYTINWSTDGTGLRCFSKRYDHPANPSNDFVAVMTCSEADENCPFIPGASLRFSLTYQDPKEADDTPEEKKRYDDRAHQIGREMCYLMETLKNVSNG